MFEQKAALLRSNVELAVSYMEIYKDECYDLLVDRETVCSNSTHRLPIARLLTDVPGYAGSKTPSKRE
jgi:hypothetical protein